MDDYVDK